MNALVTIRPELLGLSAPQLQALLPMLPRTQAQVMNATDPDRAHFLQLALGVERSLNLLAWDARLAECFSHACLSRVKAPRSVACNSYFGARPSTGRSACAT